MIVSVCIRGMLIAFSSEQGINTCCFSWLFMARYLGQPDVKQQKNMNLIL